MNTQAHEFQSIATDLSDAQVEIYERLDQGDLLKLIFGTHMSYEMEAELVRLGWRKCINTNPDFIWTPEWIEKLKSTHLLAPFYVYLKRATRQ